MGCIRECEIDYRDDEIGNVDLDRTNLNNILEMLREFRNWNREWDVYSLTNPQDMDAFAELLSTRWKVERAWSEHNIK